MSEVCLYLEKEVFETIYLPVSEDGLVDPTDAAHAVRPTTILITIMHANNEVVTVQPIAEISRIANAKPKDLSFDEKINKNQRHLPQVLN